MEVKEPDALPSFLCLSLLSFPINFIFRFFFAAAAVVVLFLLFPSPPSFPSPSPSSPSSSSFVLWLLKTITVQRNSTGERAEEKKKKPVSLTLQGFSLSLFLLSIFISIHR